MNEPPSPWAARSRGQPASANTPAPPMTSGRGRRLTCRSPLLLTTQYLEEADRLADTIVVIDQGRIIAEGPADELKAQVGGERVELVVEGPSDVAPARGALEALATGDVQVDEHARRLTAPIFGNVNPAAPPPDVWSLQNPVLYTLIWAAAIVAVFVLLAVGQYKRTTRR